MTDFGVIARATKRVTFDDIYAALDAIRDQQAEDTRHLNQRIDNLGSQLNQRIDNLSQKIDTQISSVRQEIGQLNQRFDTVLQMLMEINKEISKKNQ